MRFLPIALFVLVAQLLSGCETQATSATPIESPAAEDVASAMPASFDPSLCPAVEAVVCAEPEIQVVERVVERKVDRVIEVPVAKDKLVLGSEEIFTVEPGGVRLMALVDTGAATCSLSVLELTRFERDGSDWVRFKLEDDDEGLSEKIELPIKRHVRVARPGFDRQRRPIVDMSLTVGEVTHIVEVNLVERGEFEFPLLVGRNFLKDAAVVDVSRKLVQGKPKLPVISK
ncbi:ATP-dependent zinc protease family protein [Microbulbifer pacificus]|uniref:RimK/LysX family protein n=1 Tax=Microbulbifer pacificus TaxID=407164 RepID=A0AAU0MWH8_9GAMM|nr:RimK/LysX family protein [Microbulbifer pacificus]WOX05015.1 RimK/LysX family protein [Microbulbifer pacificus]